MKWLNRTPTPPNKQPTLSPRSITIETRPVAPRESALVPVATGDESDQTQKSAVPDEIKGELTPAPATGPSRRNPDRHHCPTLASPIPAILAESMSLAQEDPSPRPATEPLKPSVPERR